LKILYYVSKVSFQSLTELIMFPHVKLEYEVHFHLLAHLFYNIGKVTALIAQILN